jgi:hypothetical protein
VGYPKREWTVQEKARVISEGSCLSGEQLTAYLVHEERFRSCSLATARRIRQLERELARKENALAEAAALLVLKKTVQSLEIGECLLFCVMSHTLPGSDEQVWRRTVRGLF